MTLEEIPRRERPRKKLERKGCESLSDSELLAVFLSTGNIERSLFDVCRELMKKYTLKQLSNRSLKELEGFEGISNAKASQIVAFGELARRSSRESVETIECFEEVKKSVEDMKLLESECLRCFYLSSGNKVLRKEDTCGRVGSVEFEPQDVLRPGVEAGCSAIIMAHNHPSGRSAPTSQDIAATRKLKKSAEQLGIELLDHVIVGSNISSMRERTDLWKE